MIKLMQFCNTFNLEFRIIPDTSLLDNVSIWVKREADNKMYRQVLTHEELYGYRADIWFDFENYIFERIVEEFHLGIDTWKQLKREWEENRKWAM